MTGTFGLACVIVCLVLLSESVNGYVVTSPRDAIVLLGDRVELDCIINTSHPLEWHLIRGGNSDSDGSSKDVWISRGNQTSLNVSNAFRIRHDVVGQFSLFIDPVPMSLAGRYQCYDTAEEETYSAEVAVLNRTPSCEESRPTRSPSRKIVCSFGYAGNLKPELEWMTLGNSSWNALCNASSITNTVDCIFESSCTVHNQSVNANTFLIKCLGESSTCEWGKVSSSVGSLRIMSSKKTVGSWHCASPGVAPSPTTSPNPTVTDESSHKTSRNCRETVVGLGTAVAVLATSTIAFFVGCFIALTRLRNAKGVKNVSSYIDGSQAVQTAVEYEEMHEREQQSMGLSVYQNVPTLQAEYQKLEIIDQQLQ